MFKKITLIAVLLYPLLTNAQKNVVFYEVIRHDSLLFFFNNRAHFTQKNCAQFTRFIKINADGKFHGAFHDLDHENNIKGKGSYSNGDKDGYFESYYPNGKLKEKRYYSKNKPVGTWESFNENGLPARTLKFDSGDTLLIRLIDEKGNIIVSDGTGDFEGQVSGFQGSTDEIIAKGEIVNGKAHGKWTSSLGKLAYAKETFDNGKLVKGVFPNARLNATYMSRSNLNRFILPDYIDRLEKMVVETCADTTRFTNSSGPKELDLNNFNSEVRRKIDKVLEEDMRAKNTEDYFPGDQFLTIRFSIDENGKGFDFRHVNAWGRQYYQVIASTIRSYVKFPAARKEYYFHFKLSISGGGLYRYNYNFTTNMSNQL
jgi:hypothetical protein